MSTTDAILLTGATGFVGTELLARYLQRTDRTVYALVRARDDEHATERLRETLAGAFGSTDSFDARVRAIAGDITQPGLGLHPDAALEVAGAVSEIVHGAASVSFELELEASRAINVEGTRRMLAFAELCRLEGGLRRFTYISTAYVAGTHRGVFCEDDLEVGQGFRNPYEQSKHEAELLVRDHARCLPVTVVRPSIVVGDRHSGWTASFNVLYWPLRALARGSYPVLPARRGAPVDVVSIDYVADAIVALAASPAAQGRTFHLTASDAASSIGELLELAVARLDCRRPPLLSPWLYRRVVHPLLLRAHPRRRRFLRATESYLPYFAVTTRFDNARARAALGPAIAPAPLATYFDALVGYALRARWGARPLTRAAAAGAAAAADAPSNNRARARRTPEGAVSRATATATAAPTAGG
jgi:thioester reductase-like protein